MIKPFIFIYGDDYLAHTKAKGLLEEKKAKLNALSCEIIEGSVDNLGQLEAMAKNLQQAVQTLSLFSEKKLIWLKNANFLGDTITAKAEGAKEWLELIKDAIKGLNPDQTELIISASLVDRRTREFKWFQEVGEAMPVEAPKEEAMQAWIYTTLEGYGVKIQREAAQLLQAKTQNNQRLLGEEIKKIATYVGTSGKLISVEDIHALVPNFGEGDFFEPVEAFFSKNLQWTLEAIKNYFFIQKEPRPVLTALQNRSRILIQLRVLTDAKLLKVGEGGIPKVQFESLKEEFLPLYEGFEVKNACNIFTQNVWYLGQIAKKSLAKWSRKELLSLQQEFIHYFESLIASPQSAQENLELLAIRCLK